MATVDALITTQQSYALSVKNQADAQFAQMRLDIANIGSVALVSTGAVNLPAAPEIPDALTAPTLAAVDLTIPAEPTGAPVFQDISPIEAGTAPVLTATAPTLVLPSLPSQLGEFAQTAPGITTSFNFPTAPAALDIEILAPSLAEHAMPTAPTIALPSFDAVAPTGISDAPTDLNDRYVASYRELSPQFVAALEERQNAALLRFNPRYNEQVASIHAQLTTYLAGGTGLAPAVENAIYERAKGKDLGEYRRMQRAAFKSAADRGFTLPDGAAMSAIRKARQGASDNLARSSNEIAIAQAEREQQNLQWAVNQLMTLGNATLAASISYHGNLVAINGQALQAARDVLGAVVEVYNLTVKAYEVRLGGYRTEVTIFEARLKAAMSHLDWYKAELDAVQTAVQIDQAQVSLYKGKIDALQALAGVYRSRIEAVVSEAGLEKLKLDLFEAQVKAFAATASVKESEYRGYTAAISGQEALVRVFGEQVNAHTSRVSAYRAEIEAKAVVVRSAADTNQARASQYRSTVDAFSAIVNARGDVARTQLETQRAQLNVFDSQVRATLGTSQLQLGVYEAQSKIILDHVRLDIEALLRTAEQRIQQLKAVADVATSSGAVYGNMAGSALSSLNTLVAQTNALAG